ncbi:E3 ubiquitin-protein ligase rnf168 isoform X2 [Antennarius striatus]|uniref:E3 ubiquitin-protein ligase rnf168 isoform X2 n=1 Tax=Antennarius striatus TaxID=241820 RepID=UPI0035AFD09B
MGPGSGRGGVLSLEDCRCPVCLEILMEPVTLPCTHTFCKGCFLEAVDKASLCCPLCRRRVSTWVRLHGRRDTLVDQGLWTRIQTTFPLQCQRRLSGQDAPEDRPPASVCPRVSPPGELRQEYEDQLTEERRVLDEEQRLASEELIHRLLAEEEAELQQERRRSQEDERLARQLSIQLETPPPPPDVTAGKKKKKEGPIGQMDRFLSPRQTKSSTPSFTSNKENILQAGHAPPHLDCCASQSAEEEQLRPGPSSAKRKSSKMEPSEEEEPKRARPAPAPPSPLEGRSLLFQGVALREEELLSRRQQEEEDRRLALLLQRELDQEGPRAPDRRKGSSDAYPLRRPPRGGGQGPRMRGRGQDPSSSRTTRTTTSSPPPSRTKQATLTEMFSCLGS